MYDMYNILYMIYIIYDIYIYMYNRHIDLHQLQDAFMIARL